MLMPEAAIAQSVATASLPTFSAQYARGEIQEMRSSLAATLRGVLLLAIPATVGLILLRIPIVSIVYQRNAFTSESAQLVAWALLWYSAGLIGHSVVEIVARAFYALHDTKTPVIVGIAAMSLNLIFSLIFTQVFIRLGWMPHGALAFSNSLATLLEMVGLLILMRKRLDGLETGHIWQAVRQAGLSALAMGAGLWWWISRSSGSSAVVITLGGIVLGVAIYGLGLVLQHTDEVGYGWNFIRSFIHRKTS